MGKKILALAFWVHKRNEFTTEELTVTPTVKYLIYAVCQ
jgi:hypothetical protein